MNEYELQAFTFIPQKGWQRVPIEDVPNFIKLFRLNRMIFTPSRPGESASIDWVGPHSVIKLVIREKP